MLVNFFSKIGLELIIEDFFSFHPDTILPQNRLLYEDKQFYLKLRKSSACAQATCRSPHRQTGGLTPRSGKRAFPDDKC
ncbi:hypothetical protein TRIP_B330452 [uncultured Desulfatiglans sp.]|uniref:Uncharacterized protein n=1 Tax=Uncultured Desulfatiglans sp. TaxID=1748965 RepID=A0A653A8E7_UNCDX|nr:hypothetical protein TRIP_B330452 [uncultured Desulfatiglans sp.]